MRFPHFPGVGQRIKARLVAIGYVNDDGTPDIAGFIRDHRQHYDPRSFYPWINKDRTPTGPNLDRLVDDLRTSRAWLLHGEGDPEARYAIPIGGGSYNPQGATSGGTIDAVGQLPDLLDVLPLIGSILRRLRGLLMPTLPPLPVFAPCR